MNIFELGYYNIFQENFLREISLFDYYTYNQDELIYLSIKICRKYNSRNGSWPKKKIFAKKIWLKLLKHENICELLLEKRGPNLDNNSWIENSLISLVNLLVEKNWKFIKYKSKYYED